MENNFHLSNKCALFYNMKRYYEALGRDPFEVIPLTFHIKKGTDDPEFYVFVNRYKEFEEQRSGNKSRDSNAVARQENSTNKKRNIKKKESKH